MNKSDSPEARFCLNLGESLPDGFGRILREQLNSAITELSKQGRSLDKAVHEARKCLKRTRSVLRLIRPAIPAAYARENHRLRDVGRQLSEVRDTQALIETVRSLEEDGKGDGFKDVVELLQNRKNHVVTELKSGGHLKSSLDQLRRSARDIDEVSLRKVSIAVSVESLRSSVKRGKKALAKAYSDPQADNFHEWRKRAKDMRYQTEVLSALWPDVLEGYSKSAKELEQLLGEDHNLAVLEEVLKREHPASGNLSDVIKKKQDKLRKEAKQLGARLYSEPTKAWARRLQSGWEVWRTA